MPWHYKWRKPPSLKLKANSKPAKTENSDSTKNPVKEEELKLNFTKSKSIEDSAKEKHSVKGVETTDIQRKKPLIWKFPDK